MSSHSASPDASSPHADSSALTPSKTGGTLYDPPAADDTDQPASDPVDEQETLRLELPESLAERLQEVALHLGLSPSLVASRAIDLICEEVGTVDSEPLSTDTLIQQYQARLDLLHTLENATEEEDASDEDGPSWDAVDEIIEIGEESKKQ